MVVNKMNGQNYKAIVRYVGTNFAGWQVQPGERTVQGEIMSALARIAGAPVKVDGASRTDAGVHALGQVCSFRLTKPLDPERLRRSLSGMLRPEIRIESLDFAPESFHARKSSRSKVYRYAFTPAREADPFSAPFTWQAPRNTDLELLRGLCARVEGCHDFAGFEGSRASAKRSTVRTLFTVRLESGGVVSPCDRLPAWHLAFHGDGFLYKMVRNITGTLFDIARGHLPEERLQEQLNAPGPYRGFTAPAHGLTLVEVKY